MTAVKLVPAAWRHVNRLAREMRACDVAECAALGRTPKQALRLGIGTSLWAMTALVDGEPHAMFGLVVVNAMTREGAPWMLGSERIYRHGRDLLTKAPSFFGRMSDSCDVLSNVVGAGNDRAIRLLKRWGFTVDPEHERIGGMNFRRFHMELP